MKNTRLEIRCDSHQKDTLEKAAKLRGVSVSAFILMSVMSQAELEILKDMYGTAWSNPIDY